MNTDKPKEMLTDFKTKAEKMLEYVWIAYSYIYISQVCNLRFNLGIMPENAPVKSVTYVPDWYELDQQFVLNNCERV